MPPTLVREYLFTWQLGRFLFGLPAQGVLSQPPVSLGRLLGRRPFVRFTTARGRVTTDPQSPKGGSQRFRRVTIPRLLGVSQRWRCFGSHALPLTNGGVFHAVVPCGPLRSLFCRVGAMMARTRLCTTVAFTLEGHLTSTRTHLLPE